MSTRSSSTASTTVASPFLPQMLTRIKMILANAQQKSVNGTRNSSRSIRRCSLKLFWLQTISTSSPCCEFCLITRSLPNFKKILSDVGCKTVANMIKGKTPEEIRKLFNIVNDFTPEEEVGLSVTTCKKLSHASSIGSNQEGER